MYVQSNHSKSQDIMIHVGVGYTLLNVRPSGFNRTALTDSITIWFEQTFSSWQENRIMDNVNVNVFEMETRKVKETKKERKKERERKSFTWKKK